METTVKRRWLVNALSSVKMLWKERIVFVCFLGIKNRGGFTEKLVFKLSFKYC